MSKLNEARKVRDEAKALRDPMTGTTLHYLEKSDWLEATYAQLNADELLIAALEARNAELEAALKRYQTARVILGECWSALAYLERSGHLPLPEVKAILADLQAWNAADAQITPDAEGGTGT